jgi:hypothetical protein
MIKAAKIFFDQATFFGARPRRPATDAKPTVTMMVVEMCRRRSDYGAVIGNFFTFIATASPFSAAASSARGWFG